MVILPIYSPYLGRFFCSCTDNCYIPYRPLRDHCSAPDEPGRTGLEYWLGNLDGCNHRGHGVVGALAVRAARFLEASRQFTSGRSPRTGARHRRELIAETA